MADPMVQLEAAIMARLGAAASSTSTDPDLATLLPGGVNSRSAGEGEYPFLTVSLVRMDQRHTFEGVTSISFLYYLSVTDRSESVDAASAALAKVHDLLQDAGSAGLPMADFSAIYSRRVGRTGVSPSAGGVQYQRITDEYRIEVVPQ